MLFVWFQNGFHYLFESSAHMGTANENDCNICHFSFIVVLMIAIAFYCVEWKKCCMAQEKSTSIRFGLEFVLKAMRGLMMLKVMWVSVRKCNTVVLIPDRFFYHNLVVKIFLSSIFSLLILCYQKYCSISILIDSLAAVIKKSENINTDSSLYENSWILTKLLSFPCIKIPCLL